MTISFERIYCPIEPTSRSVGNIVELDEVHVFASAMPCDFEQIAYVREAALAGETRRDLFERDRDDGVDFDLAFFKWVAPAGAP